MSISVLSKKYKESSSIILNWFSSKNWTPFEFQKQVWEYYSKSYSGLLNAPTGSGKTYAMWFAVLIDYIIKHPDDYKKKKEKGLQLLWITPLKALSKDIERALQESCDDLEIPWKVSTRTGDTSSSIKLKQMKNMYEVLITTPESLHLMLCQKDYPELFKNLKAVVTDEWHELLGNKRGVQAELALSRLKNLNNDLRIWGISATIGNMNEAMEVLLGRETENKKRKKKIIIADINKKIEVESVLPDEVEKFPWAGYLGIKLLDKVIPIVRKSKSTLIFTNTRSQSEIWFQKILEYYPEFAGHIALHHGSIDRKIRDWVENSLHKGNLKIVVCTSSLDLGVDFTPVETVIQIGSPKGVARFLQRAGRSGHQPDAVSKIYFVPTHSLELVEGAALKEAMRTNSVEDRQPLIKPYDVLIQYLVTLAVGDGFEQEKIYEEIKSTFAYQTLREDEWNWLMRFITSGGDVLKNYDEYSKVEFLDGLYKVTDRRKKIFHKMSIGTIVSDLSMNVKYLKGSSLGSIEESFLTQLKPGDVFSFAGRNLELIHIRETTAYVKKTKQKSNRIPSWLGGRMPLSSELSEMLRLKLNEALKENPKDIELRKIKPLIELQAKRSIVPKSKEFLIEKFKSQEGYHLFFYPFEGRLVHEGMAALFAYRISKLKPISFSLAMNDYGFELLSDVEIPIVEAIKKKLFDDDELVNDILKSINSSEMAKRRFRQIARITGLIFQGYPGKYKTTRNLQASSGLLFDVFSKYEPDSLLIKQSYEEMMQFQLEESRLRRALNRIRAQKLIITHPEKPTPFSFPIMVDRLREKITSEKLEDRVKKMQLRFEL
ncbi:MAG: ligase-associated DNA damage response DEXH box helicase [Bacteroidota bacterium]|nr:ligase-associated DNA damage response DEXH box helicase [Bacteroidota bacterium]